MSALDALPGLLNHARDKARLLVDVPRELVFFVPGCAYYLATGTTPFRAYGSMRRLFCLTDGRFNDAVSNVLGFFKPPVPLDTTKGVLGDMQGGTLDRVVGDLDRI